MSPDCGRLERCSVTDTGHRRREVRAGATYADGAVMGGLTLLTGCGPHAAGLTPAQHQLLLAIIGQTTPPRPDSLRRSLIFAVACG